MSLTLFSQSGYDEIFDKAAALLPHNPAAAEKLVAPALLSSEKTNNEKFITNFNFLMGRIRDADGKYYLALQYYKKALNSKVAAGKPAFLSACYGNIGNVYSRLNNFPEAIKNMNKALVIDEKLGDSVSINMTLGNIALLDANNKNYPEAERKTKQALSYFTRHKMDTDIPRYYQNLAMFYKDQKNFGPALANAHKAIALYKDANDYAVVQCLYMSDGTNTQELEKAVNSFRIQDLSLYTTGINYTVEVATLVDDMWTDYGPVCTVSTITASQQRTAVDDDTENMGGALVPATEAQVFPNPYVDAFSVSLEGGNGGQVYIEVYDLTGKQLDTMVVGPELLYALRLGEKYASGLYTVTVSQDTFRKTVKILKKVTDN